jgi:Spy/CpxP family protein refolding chaperone
MKLKTTCAVLIVAVAGSVGATLATAQTTSPAPTTAPGKHWGHMRGSMFLGTLLRATKQLNLTADQQANIKSILAAARAQHAAAGGNSIDMVVAGNPGDANFATAIQSAKTNAVNRVQQESDLAVQIYNQLNTQQKQQLPQVLASMKAAAAQRREQWLQQHGASGSSN